MGPIIKVENLGKKYVISHQRKEKYSTLRDTISNKFKETIKKSSNVFKKNKIINKIKEEFWALKDISFEINEGDKVGIIGRNGAGKSTLLKILSRITEPTTGKFILKGRVASLLEVGTGFHPELTGRENIYLNGAILGMTRSEIKSKFDEIVDFAEIEKFLDTPVKRYSSGMYVRLAFSVAAHIEPEILIIDEVLAVGDAAFQKKCLGKMGEIGKQGRTLLFVSHNMAAVSSLCDKIIYLKSGNLERYGNKNEVIPSYINSTDMSDNKGIQIKTYIKETPEVFDWIINSTLSIDISWEKYRYLPGWECDIACYTVDGSKIFAVQSQKLSNFSSDSPESNNIIFYIKNIGFIDRNLRFDIGIRKAKDEPYDVLIENCISLMPSNINLPTYKREDVIIVPEISCMVNEK